MIVYVRSQSDSPVFSILIFGQSIVRLSCPGLNGIAIAEGTSSDANRNRRIDFECCSESEGRGGGGRRNGPGLMRSSQVKAPRNLMKRNDLEEFPKWNHLVRLGQGIY
jgi:hypothetical protein